MFPIFSFTLGHFSLPGGIHLHDIVIFQHRRLFLMTPLSPYVQVDVTLLEYSLNAVTEGIDALATTRVLIRGENNHISTRSGGQSGEILHRTFRCVNCQNLQFLNSAFLFIHPMIHVLVSYYIRLFNNCPSGIG